MAKYRLLEAHELETQDGTQRLWLPGDKEGEPVGKEGTVVGDGTPFRVRWPTLMMAPLDDEARAMIKREERRLAANQAVMNPVEALPLTLAGVEQYEDRYIPGMEGHLRRPPRPDGAAVAQVPEPPPEPEEEEEEEEEPEEEEPPPPRVPPRPAAHVSRETSPVKPLAEQDDLLPLPEYVPPPKTGVVVIGRPPYGWQDKERTIPDPEQQAVLGEIRKMHVAKYPIGAMIGRLNQLGMKPPERHTIRSILERERLGS